MLSSRRAAALPRPSLRASAAAVATAQIIDGKKVAEQLRSEIAEEVKKMQAAHGLTPGLAVVLVGSRKDSQVGVAYVVRLA